MIPPYLLKVDEPEWFPAVGSLTFLVSVEVQDPYAESFLLFRDSEGREASTTTGFYTTLESCRAGHRK